jgi:hypothetical protein
MLHLKNGDRVAGSILSEDTNHVVISNTWIKELSVPVGQIQSRETVPVAGATAALPGGGQTNMAVAPPASVTNSAVGLTGAPVAAVSVVPPIGPKPPKRWSGEARIGADFLYGANNQQIYYGRLKVAYERPYVSNPKEFVRNIFDFSMDYGWTKTLSSTNSETVLSANRLDVSDKLGVDIGKKFYVYNLASVGYDEVRKINFRDEVGPGLGYHLFTEPRFVANVESGLDYQEQYRSDDTVTRDFFARFAEDLTWKVNHHVTLTEKFEFFPELDLESYRSRFESTLSYALWQNLSLNLTVLDLYDSKPAEDVPYNDLQVRSSLGWKF